MLLSHVCLRQHRFTDTQDPVQQVLIQFRNARVWRATETLWNAMTWDLIGDGVQINYQIVLPCCRYVIILSSHPCFWSHVTRIWDQQQTTWHIWQWNPAAAALNRPSFGIFMPLQPTLAAARRKTYSFVTCERYVMNALRAFQKNEEKMSSLMNEWNFGSQCPLTQTF